MKSIGYSDTRGVLSGGPKQPASQEVSPEQTSKYPRLDFSLMIPYKPKSNAFSGEHPLNGGTFPKPPALAALCTQLPPAICFRGPFVSIDMLFDIFNRIQLPDATLVPTGDHGCDIKIFDLAKSVHWIVDDRTYAGDGGMKRRRMLPGGDDNDEETAAPVPPANDIYRLRQQKRFKK